MSFKVGDKVRVISQTGQNYIINGSSGIVTDVGVNILGLPFYRVQGESFDQWFLSSELEPVEERE